MKVALVYDRINKWGGAESVLLALHEVWPEAPLYTSVYDKKLTPWADVFEVRTSFLQNLPLPKNAHEYYPYLMGIAFESFNFDQFDLVISVTHEFAKAIITKPRTKHLCYCLAPTSYLWSGYETYFQNKTLRFLALPIVKYLRWYDEIICHRPDRYLAISQTVQKRIKKYYQLTSDIIYPPVRLASPEALLRGKVNKEGFFLIVSRLVPNKRIDIAVEAFSQLGLPLKIVGSGRQLQQLKNIAKSNIEFLGHLTDEQLSRYYQSCQALIVPGEEDFGIVSVEAQGYGKPVIAYRAGGATETVIENKTGWFFDQPTPKSLESVIKIIDLGRIKPEECIQNATRFSRERFKKEFSEYVRKL